MLETLDVKNERKVIKSEDKKKERRKRKKKLKKNKKNLKLIEKEKKREEIKGNQSITWIPVHPIMTYWSRW